MRIDAVLAVIRGMAPERYQSEWDHSGVQVSAECGEIGKLAVTLDPTPEAVGRCLEWGARFVLTHHPLALSPRHPDREGPYLSVVRALMRADCWLYAAHTSLDSAPNGPAQWLGRELGLADCRVLEPEHRFGVLEVGFFTPEPVDEDLVNDWAERDGVWSVGLMETGELRLVCDEEAWAGLSGDISAAVGRRSDWFVRRLEAPVREVGCGEVGRLPKAVSFAAFEKRLAEVLPGRWWTLCGPRPKRVRTVAYCPGSGGSLVERAFTAGADVFITGDVKYHQAVEAPGAVLDVGHFILEEEMVRRLAAGLAEDLGGHGVDVRFVPGRDPFAVRGA
ncbi:MAG: Nif3-like dinuclear metal center hexameric protein [Desulfovibrionaceae bacterium]